MKTILSAGTVAIALAAGTPSFAADLPFKAPPPAVAPACAWCGVYVGINGGYSFGSDEFNQTLVIVPGPAGLVFNSSSPNKIAPKGGLFGGQVGYNWQTGPFVLGVEGDVQWADQTDTTCGGLCGNTVVPGVVVVVGNSGATSVFQKVKWFSTARARVGWTNDSAMIYVTGGGAWMGVDETDSISFGIIPGLPTVTSAASFSSTRSGFAVGAGIEMRLWPRWTAKAEYLHLDVNGTSNTFVPAVGVFVLPGGSLTTTTGRIRDDLVRVGLNYKVF